MHMMVQSMSYTENPFIGPSVRFFFNIWKHKTGKDLLVYSFTTSFLHLFYVLTGQCSCIITIIKFSLMFPSTVRSEFILALFKPFF